MAGLEKIVDEEFRLDRHYLGGETTDDREEYRHTGALELSRREREGGCDADFSIPVPPLQGRCDDEDLAMLGGEQWLRAVSMLGQIENEQIKYFRLDGDHEAHLHEYGPQSQLPDVGA